MQKMGNKSNIASALHIAVEETADVKGRFDTGLQALRKADRYKIVVSDTRKLTGSVDIDSSTKDKYPEANRWDYAIEYGGETFFVEVHPGSTGEVKTVIAKLDWLKQWLKNAAPAIDALKSKNKSAYHWVYTKDSAILPNSKYAKMLSINGLGLPKKQLTL